MAAMPRSHKQNGTEAETKVARHLSWWWPGIKRLAPAGAADQGDLDGVPDLCIQVKAQHRLALAGWLDGATEQAARAGKPYAVVVHKRWGRGSPGQWYATLTLDDFAQAYSEREARVDL
jgi:hypothetical protein